MENSARKDQIETTHEKPEAKAQTPTPHPLRPMIRSMLIRAILCALAFGIVHLLGYRNYTSILSGTSTGVQSEGVYGFLYLAFYLGIVICVPIFLISAGLLQTLVMLDKRGARNHNT